MYITFLINYAASNISFYFKVRTTFDKDVFRVWEARFDLRALSLSPVLFNTNKFSRYSVHFENVKFEAIARL